MIWVDWVLIAAFSLAGLGMFNMMLYRHGHKTTVEMDLLLKQTRITSRLWTGLGIYRDHLHELDKYQDILVERWQGTRKTIHTRFGYDLGPIPTPPVFDHDVACLLVDIEENTL
jgi:hypothetical protein